MVLDLFTALRFFSLGIAQADDGAPLGLLENMDRILAVRLKS